MITLLFVACLLCAAVPALLFASNMRLFHIAPKHTAGMPRRVSVLIPARDEEANIEDAVRCVLASPGVELECIVLDDQSSDRTASIVKQLAQTDSRVRLHAAPALPAGWCGKQHACHILSLLAKHEVLCFVDADVRLAPDALERISGFLHVSGASLVSGFPRQQMDTWMEKLLLPLIHFVLLGFLPIGRMRQSVNPAYAAACGQLMVARREDYHTCGGHEAIRASMHDGLQLPRAFRQAGFRTDIFDATDVAVCHMYTKAAEVWNGLAKNATEGMAAPSRIVPLTLVLLLGQVVPVLMVLWSPWFFGLVCVGWLPRLWAARKFRQPFLYALAHPLGVSVLLAIQWYALARKTMRKPSGWKSRAYVTP